MFKDAGILTKSLVKVCKKCEDIVVKGADTFSPAQLLAAAKRVDEAHENCDDVTSWLHGLVPKKPIEKVAKKVD